MAEPRPEAVPQRAVLADAMEHANLPVARRGALPAHRRPPLPRRPVPADAQPGHGGQRPGRVRPARSRPRSGPPRSTRCWRGRAERPPAVPAPTGDALLELIELAVGEPVPPEYEAMTAEDMGFDRADGPPSRRRRTSGWSSSAPACRACSPRSGSPRRASTTWCWRRTPTSAAPGWRTPTRARASTPPATSTPTRSRRGAGPPTSASATRCSPTCATSPTRTTCARSSGSAPRWRARSTATSAGPSPPPRARRSPPTP